MQGTKPALAIMRATRRLAVDGDRRSGVAIFIRKTSGNPGLKTGLKRFRPERGKNAANAIPRWNAIGQGKHLPQPIFFRFGPALNRRGARAANEHAAHGYDEHVAEQVATVACVSGIGERLEVLNNRLQRYSAIGHRSYPPAMIPCGSIRQG